MCTWITDIIIDHVDPQQYGSINGTSTVHTLVELVHKRKSVVQAPEYFSSISAKHLTESNDEMCITWTSEFCHQMVDIFPVLMQTAGKDRECEIGAHHCLCRCPTGNNIWTN